MLTKFGWKLGSLKNTVQGNVNFKHQMLNLKIHAHKHYKHKQ